MWGFSIVALKFINLENYSNSDRDPDVRTSFSIFAFSDIVGKLLVVEIYSFRHRVAYHREIPPNYRNWSFARLSVYLSVCSRLFLGIFLSDVLQIVRQS